MYTNSHRWLLYLGHAFSALCALALFTDVVLAANSVAIPQVNVIHSPTNFCAQTGLCLHSGGPGGFIGLFEFLEDVLLPSVRTIFIAVAIVYFGWYAIYVIVDGSNENALTEGRKAFAQAAFGMALVGVSSWLAMAVSPSTAGQEIVSNTPVGIAVTASTSLQQQIEQLNDSVAAGTLSKKGITSYMSVVDSCFI